MANVEVEKSSKVLVIWRLLDGKPGHENQSLGLVNAIGRQMACQVYDIKVSPMLGAMKAFFTATWRLGEKLAQPDLLIGAGHATHLHLLAASRIYGGQTMVLMKPSLPISLFDLCLIPEHDAYHKRDNVIQTRGVLNDITVTNAARDAQKSLIMIGGPSKHFAWDSALMVSQIADLIKQNPDTQFIVTTSRRTPPSFLKSLDLLKLDLLSLTNIEIVSFERTASNWVAHQLAQVSSAWISEDSVSMVYEALTAQVAVGLLNVQAKRKSRVSNGIENLVQRGDVARFDASGLYKRQLRPVIGFNEANRCAKLITQQLSSAKKLNKISSIAH